MSIPGSLIPARSFSPVNLIRRFRTPEMLLMLMAAAVPLAFATWSTLINNFAVERAAFDGSDYGLLQSVREVPGFLAFLVVFLLLVMKEQSVAIISLLMLGIGTAATGLFPTLYGLLFTTLLMSVGYHYYETIQNSLALQWIDRDRAPFVLGKIIAVGSFTSLLAFALLFVGLKWLGLEFKFSFAAGGFLCVVIALIAWLGFPHYPSQVRQHKEIILRKRYWLYYLLTFMSGARRQIFVVFAGFLMVEKFGYGASSITLLFLVNCAINIWLAPIIGRLIGKWGERNALTCEYIGLIIIFISYAFVESAAAAAALYILDHIFFAMAIAIKTYFQKIADRADIASTAGVAFTINHIAAVVLPVSLGVLWLTSPSAVFLVGAGFACASLLLSFLVPDRPAPGNETRFPFSGPAAVQY